MTDEEILFDFYTVAEQQEETRKQQLERYEAEPETGEEAEPSPIRVVPDNPMDHNRSKTTQVRADREDFIRWFEAEVGPWPTQHRTR